MEWILFNITLLWYLTDINKINKNGRTFLFYACESGNKNLVKYLIELGADINKENENGKITFFMACNNGNKNLIK